MAAPDSSPGSAPMACHTLSKASTVVSTPVLGSTETEPSIMVVMTSTSTGMTKAIPSRM